MNRATPDFPLCRILALVLVALASVINSFLWQSEAISKVTGIRADEVIAWEIGLLAAGGLAWAARKSPLMRFSLLVTVVAVLMVALVLCLTDGNQEILDTFLVKALATTVSVGTGALYLFWEAGRDLNV